jgi:uncharacterized protein
MSEKSVETSGVDVDLGNGFTRAQIARCISSRRLELTLLPTEKCNFRCVYCYEDFELGRMPPEVVAGVKNLISRRADKLEELQFSWFGGEPLLALPVVKDICAHAMAEAQRVGFGFNGGVTTNAYLLTPSVLEDLVDLRQTFYQVSLDGAPADHDKTRIRADGAGTFARIWENMLAARGVDREFTIQFRVHMTPHNFESLKELALMIRSEFGSDGRFRVDLQHIRNMGGSGSKNVTLMSDEQIADRARTIRSLLSTGQLPSEPSAAARPAETQAGAKKRVTERGSTGAGGNDICYAAKPNHWMIRANGNIGRCTVILNDARNELGRLLPDGTMELRQDRISPWFTGFDELDVDRLACPAIAVPPIKPARPVIAIEPARS